MMKTFLLLYVVFCLSLLNSCESGREAVGPESDSSINPWNTPSQSDQPDMFRGINEGRR